MQSASPLNPKLRAREIFLDALEVGDACARASFVASACGSDSALRSRVELLLSDHFSEDGFMISPAAGEILPPQVPDQSGESIVRYRLLEKIGEGGMGGVYLAEQEEPVRRKVALKIIKLGMDTRQVVARFEAERQALALMDHPNIARVLDGGATETGRPFFVMELVQGVPITDFCEKNRLSTEERLKLFIPVCQAIQSAHQKGVIHRDIKPSNVLVALHDGVPVPKVIDFGVAKAIDQKLTDKTLLTNFPAMIGTPAYMSPEQAEMGALDVDTRSDIYSLGVLLYELLTGTTPFPEQCLRRVAFAEMQRIVLHEEPERPSTRLKKTASFETVAGRAARPSSLANDLDWIVMKCLEKDRNRRYETANGLAADLKRHLNNEPVVACPPTRLYRFQKMLWRNKFAFTATTAVALALLAGMGATSWQAVRARRAEQRQRLERVRAEDRFKAAMRFFDRAFNSVAPALAGIIGAAQPREELARAAADVLDDLRQGDEPDAAARAVLGQLYLQLALSHGWYIGNTTGEYEAALRAVSKAIPLLESAAAAASTDTNLSRLYFAEQAAGMTCAGLLKYQDAIDHFQKSSEWATRLGQKTTSSYFSNQSVAMKGWARDNIGGMLVRMGRCEEAITDYFLPELARLRERGNSDQSPNIWDVWDLKSANDSLGMAYYRIARYEEALPYLREALRFIEVINQRRAHSAQFSSALAVARAEAGEVLLRLDQPEEGLHLLREAANLADDLGDRDPANPGFIHVQIEVAWRGAAGLTAWANDSSASLAERRTRLDQAETHLNRAYTLLATLKSPSLRQFIEHDLRPVRETLVEIKRNLPTP